MSKLPKKNRDKSSKMKFENRDQYISRITKTLYYAKLPQDESLSLPLTELAAELFSQARRERSLDRLHYDEVANMAWDAFVSPCSLVVALLYLERLKKNNPHYVDKTASSELFLVSLMVSFKFLYDDGDEDETLMEDWAYFGGMPTEQLIQLEREFLKAIDWEVFVNKSTFWRKLNEIELSIAQRQGNRRGFFTYTELETLLTTINVQHLVQFFTAISTILIASYTAALLTLFGTVFIASHIPGGHLSQKTQELEVDRAFTLSENSAALLNEMNSTALDSIELSTFCNLSEEFLSDRNVPQNSSWDWWNVPTLKYLSEISEAPVDNEDNNSQFSYFYEEYLKEWSFKTINLLLAKNTKLGKWTPQVDNNEYYRDWNYYIQVLKS